MMKKIVIAGGTGFIGSYLDMRFRERGYKVVLVSRDKAHVPWELTALTEVLNKADILINLAGKSINCRHNPTNKKAILESRIKTTELLGEAILNCTQAPKLWINASATGVYKPSISHPMSEDETELGNDFLAEVVTSWEKVFFGRELVSTRQVALRTSVVLGKNGGALGSLVRLTRLGLGGKQASGTQMFSWIHLEDYFRVVLFLQERDALQGVFNCTAPHPISNDVFMHALRNLLHVPFGIPAPEFVIRLGAKLIGTEPELILNSAYVVPKKLSEGGFKFSFPEINKALQNLLSKR